MIEKLISEEHFVKVVYDYLVYQHDSWVGDQKEGEEYRARIAVDLHKDYWNRFNNDTRHERPDWMPIVDEKPKVDCKMCGGKRKIRTAFYADGNQHYPCKCCEDDSFTRSLKS